MKSALFSLSSLSAYFKVPLPGIRFQLVEGSIVDIAKLYDNVEYPGVDGIDALVREEDTEIFFKCSDSISRQPAHPLSTAGFLYDPERRVYLDTTDCYCSLRDRELKLNSGFFGEVSFEHLLEAAAIVSLFGFKPSAGLSAAFEELSAADVGAHAQPAGLPPALLQRVWLTAVVSGEFAAAGLKMLRDFGAVEVLWPELNALIGLDQAKEYHPEGDVWDHSLETLFHRKTRDPDLSLALLLHDLGKPLSEDEDGNRFNNHAQIGRRAAERFLRRLEFPADKIEKISFLVENHMLPAAITRLPAFRTEKAMLNPHFPLLLEVYRCDLLSSFRDPEGYYEACKAYRRFIKNTKNPFRNADGRKMLRLYVE